MAKLKASCEYCGDLELVPSDVKVFRFEVINTVRCIYRFACRSDRHPSVNEEGDLVSKIVIKGLKSEALFLLAKVGCEIVDIEIGEVKPTISDNSATSRDIQNDLLTLENASVEEFQAIAIQELA